MEGASRYVVARWTTTAAWSVLASGTATNATITYRTGLNKYSLFAVGPKGDAIEMMEFWTYK